MKVILPVICSLVVAGFLQGQGATQEQKSLPRVYTVAGTGWQTCSDWRKSDLEFKLGYVMGRVEANTQVAQILGGVPGAREVKEAFDPPSGLATGDYIKSLDKFCDDAYNARIALANAIGFVGSALAGGPPPDDKILAHLRCLGAAGADSDKVRDCYKRQ